MNNADFSFINNCLNVVMQDHNYDCRVGFEALKYHKYQLIINVNNTRRLNETTATNNNN